MCVLNQTSVYLHLILYIIDQLRTVFFILAKTINSSRIYTQNQSCTSSQSKKQKDILL